MGRYPMESHAISEWNFPTWDRGAHWTSRGRPGGMHGIYSSGGTFLFFGVGFWPTAGIEVPSSEDPDKHVCATPIVRSVPPHHSHQSGPVDPSSPPSRRDHLQRPFVAAIEFASVSFRSP